MADVGQEAAQNAQQNCIFCHIISGRVQSKKIYEDESTVGILDINPANPGHVLLIPKKHYAIMPQMDDLEIGHIFTVAKSISGALLKALKADGTNIFVANGAIAGQKAPHFMIHVIPRKEGDGVTLSIPEHKINIGELLKIRDSLMPRIKAHLKMSDEDADALAREDAELRKAIEQKTAAPPLPETAGPQDSVAERDEQSRAEPAKGEADLDAISMLINPKRGAPPASLGMQEHTGQAVVHADEEKNSTEKGKGKKVTLAEIENLFRSKKQDNK